MNAYAHYQAKLDNQTVHYIHVPRLGAFPLLLIGGWPWTFWDFAQVLPRLSAFELVVPDLPGYGFSTPLSGPGIGFVETAAMFHSLMTDVLGYQSYGVYGSDWGAAVAEHLAHTHPEAVLGLHTSMPIPLDSAPITTNLWAPGEESRQQAAATWWQTGLGYFQMHVTRPQTVAYQTDSPAAMAAWIVEKLYGWSDHRGNLEDAYSRAQILATLSIYWFTRSIGSSARFYAESMRRPWIPSNDGLPVVAVPTAVAAYPKEVGATPRKWAESYFNLRRYTVMDRDGHFPAIETPESLATDMTAFFTEITSA
jgi:epoxide hydrolase